ncbi:MAG: PaaI family thioesterase [Acidimicrobiales bacterium]
MDRPEFDAAYFNQLTPEHFASFVGMRVIEARPGFVQTALDIESHHLAANGFLHAAAVLTVADTACGFGVRTILPEGASSFTTVELKSNFLGTTREGAILCEATVAHAGRTTQVWDAVVRAGERKIALFRCTQLVLYPS